MTCSSFSTWSSCWADAEARTRRNRVAIGRRFSGKPLQNRGFFLHMFISGNNCLTQILFLLGSGPPVHQRGTLMRCHGGGTGCGTRERDATHVTSPGGTREASPRHKDRGPVRLAVNAKTRHPPWPPPFAPR